ncbi:MAG TPA: hypothetical protein VHG51_05670 [Longimicrobiaceae bacterium]|nr:hypothetical protein [Longimicrobiaceae bacterium]
MRVWVLVSWQGDVASDTLGVFASRERAEAHAREDAGQELEWSDERDRSGRVFRVAPVGMGEGYAVEEFELVE